MKARLLGQVTDPRWVFRWNHLNWNEKRLNSCVVYKKEAVVKKHLLFERSPFSKYCWTELISDNKEPTIVPQYLGKHDSEDQTSKSHDLGIPAHENWSLENRNPEGRNISEKLESPSTEVLDHIGERPYCRLHYFANA